MKLLTTGQLAKLFNITKYKIRYYIEQDILTTSKVEQNGYQLFDESSIYRLYQIIIFRDIGLSIEAIKNILENETIDEELSKVEKNIELKIKELNEIKQFVSQINIAKERYQLDEIVFLEYPDRYLNVLSKQFLSENEIDYLKIATDENFDNLQEIYYLFSEEMQLVTYTKGSIQDFDFPILSGTYISKTFVVDDEAMLSEQIQLFLSDPLVTLKKYNYKDLLIFENINCALAYNSKMLYTIEVKL